MKQKTLLFSWLLAMLFSIVGASPAWGDVVNGDIFERISEVGDLSDGDEIIFVNQAETYACGTTQNTNNRTPVSISVTDHSYTYASSDNVQVFVVKINSSGKFGFHTGSGYIYSASSSSNNLKTNTTASSTDPSGTAAWTLSVSNNVFSATNVSNTSYYLAFNGTSYFSQYKSGQSKPYIFKKADVEDYAITGTSSNNSYGTVSVEGNVITATPADGYRVSTSTAYTITSGNSNVSNVAQVGNVFTVTATGDCTIQINFETIPTHTVTITSPTGGTLTVKNGEDVVSSGSSVREGTELTIIPEADNSHRFTKWIATVGGAGTDYTDVFSYTISSADVTFSATFEEVVKYAVNWSVNGNVTTAYYEEDESIVFPDDPADINGMTFVGWYGNTYSHASTAPTFVSTSTTMGNADVTYYAVFAEASEGDAVSVTDNLTRATTGVSSGTTTYSAWSGKTGASGAIYAGQSAGGNDAIQIRNQTPSGIITTTSGGKAKKVVIDWSTSTSSGRSVTVYGSNSAYTSTTNLYSSSTYGTELGTISYGTSTELSISGDYAYIGLKAGGALYMDKVSVTWESGTTYTYSNFCTTVSALPKPIITLSTTSIDMTWGDTDKTLTASATMGGEDFEDDITLTSSSANLTIDGSGNIRCNVPGDYTITASIAAKAEEYQAANDVVCNITVGKQNAAVSFGEATIQKLISDGSYTQTATKSPEGAGAVTYTISPSGNTINSSTGAVTLTTTGNYTVTATAAANTLYNEAVGSYTLQVRTTPTITVSDDNVAYGTDYEVDDSRITGGAITVTSSNISVATVDGLTITPVAVGSTIITVSTADNDTYVAGEESFTLTVTAPVGSTTKPDASPIVLFNETFNKSNGTGGRDDLYDGNVGTSSLSDKLDETWSIIGSNGASKCIKLGTSSATGTVKTGVVSLTGAGTLSYSAAGWSSGTNTVQVSATGATVSGDVNVTMSNSTWSDYTVNLTEATGSVQLTFSIKRGFLDDVKVTKPGVDISSITATIPSSGFGTYCCQYPLDLPANNEDYKAYIITAVEGNNVTFTKISGEIKGGVPFILYGTAGNYDLPVAAESETIPSGNMLTGTLAPTYITSETGANYNFGLSGGKFKKLNPGVLPANKAYLSVPKSNFTDGAREFNFIFEDGETTGIESITPAHSPSEGTQVFYDLQGRKVSKPSRGLYIVNGRKVVVK